MSKKIPFSQNKNLPVSLSLSDVKELEEICNLTGLTKAEFFQYAVHTVILAAKREQTEKQIEQGSELLRASILSFIGADQHGKTRKRHLRVKGKIK